MAKKGSKTKPRKAVNRALGNYIVGLREAKHWTQHQASVEAQKRNIDISYDKIRGIETGTRHFPAPDLLRPLAQLYGVKYDEIVRQMVRLVYGSDLAGHTSGGESSTSQADREVPPNAADAALDLPEPATPLSLAQIADYVVRLGDLAREAIDSDKDRRARRAGSGGRKSH